MFADVLLKLIKISFFAANMVTLHQRYALIGIGLLVLVLGSQGDLKVTPISKVAFLEASNVTMSCSSDQGFRTIYWTHGPVGDPSLVTISIGAYVEEPQQKFYAAEQVGSQQINLIILTATMAMTGTYACGDSAGVKTYAQLIIIDSELVCSMIPAAPAELPYDKEVQMSCSFSYFADASYVFGDMIWSKGSPATIVDSFTHTTTSADNLITATSTIIEIPGNVSHFPIHRCNATFKFTDKMPSASSKSVDYSKSIQLFDSPIVVNLDPDVDIEPPKVNETAPKVNETEASRKGGPSKSDNTGMIIGIVVAIGCVLLIAVAAIYYYRRKKKQAGSGGIERTQNKPPDDVALQSSNTNLSKEGQQDLSQQQHLSKEGQQDLSKEGQQTTNNANNSSRNNSVYSTNGHHDQRYIDEDELNYAQLQLEDYPHSLQALQLVEETTYSDVRLA